MNPDNSSPFSDSLIWLQRFWRWATPFWLFRDAGSGSREQRMANYRHNRAQRDLLFPYTLKWMAIAAAMMLFLQMNSGVLAHSLDGSPAYFGAALFCIGSGIVFSIACAVIAVLMACYLYLAHVKH
jgi:hypothetical protein